MGSQMRRSSCFGLFLLVSLLAGCGGGGADFVDNGGDGGTDPGTGTPTPVAASITLIASTSQLGSAASTSASGITISAIVKDASNNLLSGIAVSFATDAGALQVTSGTTDATGLATAILSTGGDPANRVINVSSHAGTATASLAIPEIGTSAVITGAGVVGSGSNEIFTVKLTDSSSNVIPGKAVSLASALGNPITPASAITDANGQAAFTYTGTTGGGDTLTASSASVNASSSQNVTVSSSKLSFSQPAADNTQVAFGVPQTIKVSYSQNGSPVSGAALVFSATRGTLNGTASNSASATTASDGTASVSIQSSGADGAGGSIVTAQVVGGPSANRSIVFNATVPSSISVQASPSSIAPSASSTIIARVRDANDNLVANQLVNFSLDDVTGGSLSAGSATTDQTGTVSVNYVASPVASGKNGVVVRAQVNGTSVTTDASPAYITVGGQALRITLGTGNKILVLDETRYQMPYSVVVTDSAGNAVSGATFRLSIQSMAYQKGFWAVNSTGDALVQQLKIPPGDLRYNNGDPFPFGCRSEDGIPPATDTSDGSAPNDPNGILDPGEDYNANGILDPGAVASVPSSVVLDSTGSAQFLITYPKDRAYWVETRLTAIATVAGTETTATADFVLPGSADDYDDVDSAPPGAISPYGVDTNCASSK
jgi:hypothetical protein